MKLNISDNFEKWEIGDKVTLTHKISEKDVQDFANLTGDVNPLHVDKKYASETLFGQRVVHGMLSASFISTMIGMKLPGPGALWVSQTLEFKAPARIGDDITVVAVVKSKSDAIRILELEINVLNQEHVILISGSSKVKVLEHKEKPKDHKESDHRGAAIVTGSSRGIGAEIVKKLALAGYPVVINYSRSPEEAELVYNSVILEGGRAILFKADVTDEKSVGNMVAEAVEVFGGVDVLVNNASGTIINRKFEQLDWSHVQTHLDIQLRGAINACKSVLPHMILKGRGRIINITSIYTDDVPPSQTYDYVIAKAALSSLTKSLAVEYGPRGVRVNNVSPGMTETGLIGSIPDKTKMMTQATTPLRRLARPAEVADVVAMLAGPAGDYITGETIRVCGGQRML